MCRTARTTYHVTRFFLKYCLLIFVSRRPGSHPCTTILTPEFYFVGSGILHTCYTLDGTNGEESKKKRTQLMIFVPY